MGCHCHLQNWVLDISKTQKCYWTMQERPKESFLFLQKGYGEKDNLVKQKQQPTFRQQELYPSKHHGKNCSPSNNPVITGQVGTLGIELCLAMARCPHSFLSAGVVSANTEESTVLSLLSNDTPMSMASLGTMQGF